MEEDRLRIPSTKRICFIGRTKSHRPEERKEALAGILDTVEQHTASTDESEAKRVKLEGGKFVPRAAEIKVRNCSQIDKVRGHFFKQFTKGYL